jgi:hypothetical protein
LFLVHGEPEAQKVLAKRLRDELKAPVSIAKVKQIVEVNSR